MRGSLDVKRKIHPGAVFLACTSEDSLEGGNDVCVELAFDGLSEAQPRHSTRHGVSIRPVGCHRVVRIGYSDDSGEKRNLVPRDSIRVTRPIDALVVMANYLGDLEIVIHLCQDPLADLRVLLHLPTLFERQGTRLFEEPRRKTDFPDVMDEPAKMRQLLLVR